MCPGDASNGILQRAGKINENCFWLLTYSCSIPTVKARAKAIKGCGWDLKSSQKKGSLGSLSYAQIKECFIFLYGIL